MQRKTILASAAALLIAGSATFAFAQSATPNPPQKATAQVQSQKDGAKGMHRDGFERGRFGGHGRGDHDRMRKEGGVIGNLRGLERLYVMEGRAKELPALYNEVLAKSQNPRVRNYAYAHLARAQLRPANADQAIATLRKSLDENLALDQKRHAEMEQFRSRMQQRRADSATPAPADGN